MAYNNTAIFQVKGHAQHLAEFKCEMRLYDPWANTESRGEQNRNLVFGIAFRSTANVASVITIALLGAWLPFGLIWNRFESQSPDLNQIFKGLDCRYAMTMDQIIRETQGWPPGEVNQLIQALSAQLPTTESGKPHLNGKESTSASLREYSQKLEKVWEGSDASYSNEQIVALIRDSRE
jgi:hypothetical protein